MSGWTDWRLRLRALARHRRAERELHEEIEFHQAMAPTTFGSPDLVLEECRDARGLRWLEDAARDTRLALRRLRHAPGFTAMALLTLALGIGANAALFSLVNAVLLRQLPVPHPEQLVLLGNASFDGMESGTADHAVDGLTYAQYRELREQSQAFSGLAAFSALQPTMRVGWGQTTDDAVPLKLVSNNYFKVLEVKPAAGRFFDAASPTPAPEAVLSYGYWLQRFGGRADAVGQVIRLRDQPFTVIGVAAPGFTGTTVGQQPAIYLPLELQPRVLPGRDLLHDPPGITRRMWLLGLGRLRPGATQAQARAESAVIFASSVQTQAKLARDAETRADLLTQTLPVATAARGASAVQESLGEPLLILQILVGTVLLIVTVNLGGMLLAQAASRKREFAMRLALGAGRGRLIRQLLTESLLLALIGGVLGWLLGMAGTPLLVSLAAAGTGMQLAPAAGLDPGILAFTAGIALLAGVGFGLAPALRLTRRDLARQSGRFRTGAGSAWVVAQVALALALVTGAALFTRSLSQLRRVPLGYRADHLLSFNLNAVMAGASQAQAQEVYQQVAGTARRLPGVKSATLSENGLFTGRNSGDDMTLEGYGGGNVSSFMDSVAPGYFAALGIPMLQGREFTPEDRSRGLKPMVIDSTLAQIAFAGRNPIGQMATAHYTFGDAQYEIVGVSAAVQPLRLRESRPYPRVYFDLFNRGTEPVGDVNFLVRTSPGAVLTRTQINRLVASASGLPLQINSFTSVEGLIDGMLAPDLLLAKLSGFFALLALGLAAMGIYALLSQALARRRSEIGIRMALGARAGQVAGMVVRQALALVAAGVVLGAVASVALGRGLASLLFEVKPADPVSLSVAALLLLAVGTAAALGPALRASRTDPARTLRAE